MSTNQGDVQQSIRDITSTALDYNSDWSALFDLDGIAAGDWNGRLLAWINQVLGSSYADLPGAQQAYAEALGFTNWSSMNTITVNPLSLFTEYSADGLYIPTFDPTVTAMWQENTQVTVTDEVGETIGFVTDAGPTGASITQATAGSRGLLQQPSRFVWRGDGVADHLITDLAPASAMTMILAVEANAVADQIIGSTDAGPANRCFMGVDGAGLLFGAVGNDGAAVIVGGSDIRDIPGVAVLRFDGTTVSLFWKPFSGAMTTLYSDAQDGSPTTDVLYIGTFATDGTASQHLDGDIYGVLVIQAALTDAEIGLMAHRFSYGLS